MKKLRKLSGILLAAVLVMSLIGCGEKTESGSTVADERAVTKEEDKSTSEAENAAKQEDTTEQENVAKQEDTTAQENAAKQEDTTEQENTQEPVGVHHAVITVKEYGTIKVELDGDTAPITVANFMNLANEGFYNGLTFHRIIDGFMIQGGDPLGNGTGGSDQTIKGEFAENGVENNISHKKGVISMARAQDPDSASSQFFIMVEDCDYLDGQYAAFGRVTEGLDVVLQIAKDAKPIDGNGTIPQEEQPVIESIVIED